MTTGRLLLLVIPLVCVAVFLSGCDAKHALGVTANASPATAASDATIDVATIAEKFDERYRNAKFMHLEGRTITSTGHDLRYTHDTSQDSLRTVCRSGDEIVGAFSLHAGRVQEFVPGHPKRLLLEYDSEDNLQIPNRVYRDERDCLYGYCFVIRIGPNAVHRQPICDRFRECTLKGQEKVGDSLCHVLEWSQEWPNSTDDQHISQWTFWVDVADFTLRRRHVTHLTKREGKEVDREERDFQYDVVKLFDEDPAQPFDWNIRSIAENAPRPKPTDDAPAAPGIEPEGNS